MLSLPGAARSEGKDMFSRYCLTERLCIFSISVCEKLFGFV